MHTVTIVDGKLEWREHPDPSPGPGELLVAVRAAGLNASDMLQRLGLYPAPPGVPADVPGLELAGEVVAVGPGVQRFGAGDRVMAVVGGGGQAELAVMHERTALPVPDGVSWERRVAFPRSSRPPTTRCSPSAGWRWASRPSCTAPPEASAPPASSSAVAAGAQVTATVRNPGHREAVAAFGATVVAPDGLAGHGPFDVVLELVGAPNMAADLEGLALGGRIAVIGVGAGAVAELNLARADGEAGPHPRVDPAAPAARAEGRRGP